MSQLQKDHVLYSLTDSSFCARIFKVSAGFSERVVISVGINNERESFTQFM